MFISALTADAQIRPEEEAVCASSMGQRPQLAASRDAPTTPLRDDDARGTERKLLLVKNVVMRDATTKP